MKPSEDTPLTTIKVTELAEEVGFPAGIETGREVMQAATGNIKKIAFELGGKNPNIMFDDVDFELAVDYVLNAVFFLPTFFTNCDTRMRIVQEEVFGPVWAKDQDRVQRVARALRSRRAVTPAGRLRRASTDRRPVPLRTPRA